MAYTSCCVKDSTRCVTGCAVRHGRKDSRNMMYEFAYGNVREKTIV